MFGRVGNDDALTVLMTSGFVAIPGILMQNYRKLGLADEEMMLLLHLMQFRQEGVEFPTFEEISQRMTMDEQAVGRLVIRLLKQGVLAIDEGRQSDGYGEAYDLRPLYRKLAALLEPPKPAPQTSSLDMLMKKETNLYTVFEQEFGRPLSPLEYEHIGKWLDEDRYSEALIREALSEAVLSAKFNFKYIDRILFEWQKNHIRTLQELNAYREQFRNRVPNARGGYGQGGAKNGRNTPYKEAGRPNQSNASAQDDESQENKYDAFYKMYGGRDA